MKQAATNVVPFPEPPAKTIPANSAGPWTFPVWAVTHRIGGDLMNTIYREELVRGSLAETTTAASFHLVIHENASRSVAAFAALGGRNCASCASSVAWLASLGAWHNDHRAAALP
jgi:hypothetical protein